MYLYTYFWSLDATPKDNDHFNGHFMQAFKRTQCFQEWYDVRPDAEFFNALPVGHPFAAGTLSVADVKLKIAQYVLTGGVSLCIFSKV